jgi:hypothetical protein
MTPQNCRWLPGSVRVKYGGSVTPDSRIPSCNKATNALKMRPAPAISHYDKFLQNWIESHSHDVRAAFNCLYEDPLASIAAVRRARRVIYGNRPGTATGA